MNPALISLILGIVEQLVIDEPQIAAAFQKLFSGGTPTPDDWAALRAEIEVPFATLAPDADAAADLASSQGAPPAPPAPPAGGTTPVAAEVPAAPVGHPPDVSGQAVL